MQLKYLICIVAMLSYNLSWSQSYQDRPEPIEGAEALSLQFQPEEINENDAIQKPGWSPFTNVTQSQNPEDGLTRELSMSIDAQAIKEVYESNEEFINLRLPYFDNQDLQLELHQYDLLADGFQVLTSDGGGQAIELPMGRYYRGSVKGDPKSTVAISIFQDEMIGMVTANGQNIVVHPAVDGDDYIVYNDADITKEMPFSCESLEHDEMSDADIDENAPESASCVKVYLECDNALFVNKGSSAATVNWITAVFNNMATLYSNESITTAISTIFVWTTPDSYSKTSSYNALTGFRNARRTFNGDLAHLCALGGRGLGGVAWLDVLCSSYSYAYSNIHSTYRTVPTYSWTVSVMTHEMGHNLGSRHTQWCGWSGGALDNCYAPEGSCSRGPAPTSGGTIMSYCHLTSYGINFNNGFGTQPGDKIRAEVAAAACLGTCGGGGCPAPTGLAASSITQTSATLSWNSVASASEYKLEYRVSGGSWVVINTTATSRNITGLTANTDYQARVASKCSGSYGSYSGTINFKTLPVAGCSTPSGLAASNITSSGARVAWNSVSGANSYDLQYRPSGGSWTTRNTTSTNYNITGLTASTTYQARVRAKCTSGTSSYSSIISFTTLSGGGGGYCVSKGNSASREWVKRVRASGFDRSSGDDGGYYDGTGLVGTMTKGRYNLVYFQAGKTGGTRRFYWRIWLDLNGDGDFNDSGELRVSGYSTSTRLLYSYLYVPSNAASGQTRMRVSMRYGGYPGACQTFGRGEVEDYTIDIKSIGVLPEDGTESQEEDYNWTLSPNPTSGSTMINFRNQESQDILFKIVDMHGKEMKQWDYTSQEGQNFVEIGTEGLSTGHYFVQVQYGSKVELLRLVKM